MNALEPNHWPVFGRYTTEGGYLRPGDPIDVVWSYDPTRYRELATSFAKLEEGNEQAVRAFAEEWGSPGLERLRPGSPPPLASNLRDELGLIWLHSKGIRVALTLLADLQARDPAGLERTVRTLGGPDTQQRPAPDLVVMMTFGSRDRQSTLVVENKNTFPDIAVAIIESIVLPNLSTTRLAFAPSDESEFPVLSASCAFLAAAEVAYWHVFQLATTQGELRRCEECGQLFTIEDSRQRFCPPTPKERARAKRRDKKVESPCAVRHRLKRWRASKRSAKKEERGWQQSILQGL